LCIVNFTKAFDLTHFGKERSTATLPGFIFQRGIEQGLETRIQKGGMNFVFAG
jgi:hypothetical protein